MSFEEVQRVVKREPVLAGLDRTAPAVRARVERLLERFATSDAAPRELADEGAALALWGRPDVFLEWHRELGGLPRALEVLLAALAFERAMYEWDSSIWALRAARPHVGLGNLGAPPWIWLRERLAKAKPNERDAVRAVVPATIRTLSVRCAIAFVFPDLWTDADDAELRQADLDDDVITQFGVMATMRTAKVDFGALERMGEHVITPAMMRKHLGDRAVAPLRLVRAYDALAELATPDALRALAELADVAWDAIATIKPTRASIDALVPMFTTRPPRRTLGLPLARALFDELVVAAPKEAAKTGDRFVAQAIADTGATLPPDDAWVSPWTSRQPSAKKAAAPAAPKPVAFAEQLHWRDGQVRERSSPQNWDDRVKRKELEKTSKTEKVFIHSIGWMHDSKIAFETWTAIPPGRWYGQVNDVEMLLARFELAGLESILAFVQTKPDTLAGLAGVESPRVAPLMARGFALIKKLRDVGKAWLDRFPEAAAIGLAADRATADKKQRDADDQALAYLAEKHAAIVERIAGTSAGELAAATAPKLPGKPKKLPAFVDLARLPRPIRIDGKAALQGEALGEFLQLLATGVDAAIDPIAEAYTRASLARCAFSLFRQWLFVKAPPKDKWALYAVGRFGDDDHARALGRLARVWAPQGNSARAQEAVEALALMRSRAALAEIHDIAHKVQSRALKARAEQVFATVAAASGLAAEDLADRLVPDLDESALSFGDVHAELDAGLVPHLVWPDGSDRARLPHDEFARFKELERLCAKVARGQLARLEDSMANAHRMPFLHFAEVYLMHSLIRHLASGLVWGAYQGGTLVLAFAVTAGGADTIDSSDKHVELPSDATYGVVHPIELAKAELAAWRKRLPAQPFEQLERAVHAADSWDGTRRSAYARVVPTTRLLALARGTWRRGESPQGGRYYTIERAGDGWSATLGFDPGIYIGAPTDEATQALQEIELRGSPPASVISELQRDVLGLLSTDR
ncbi:MAG TPA: DUF4132 domain-containing protein [Kofleriaceae bacterium]